MEIKEVKKKVVEALENVGIFIDENVDEDSNLKNYIEDSIQFISMIIEFEEAFGIEIPTEILMFDNFDSLDKISVILQELLINFDI